MVGFGYQDPLKGKQFDFGTAFGSSTTLNQDPSRGLTGQDSYFDTQNVYGGDRMARDRAVGRMAAGSMGATLTDRQLQNLGSGLSAFRDLVNLRTTLNGGVGSANYTSALQDPSVQTWLDSGDLLGATGFGGQDGGSAFGTLKANAQAAHDAGDQTMYRAFTSPTNFYQLADLGSRTMGGVGAQLFGQGMDDAVSAYNLGQDPFNAEGANVFGQGQAAGYATPHQDEGPVIEGGNAPSPEPPPHAPDGAMPGTAFGQNPPAGQPHPTIPGAQWETNQSPVSGGGFHSEGSPAASRDPQAALTYAFRQAQGSDPDQAQLGYLQEIANTQGLQAAVKFAGDNIIARAHRYSQTPPPKIQNSQDVQGASALYDYIVAALGQGSINQPKDQYVNNILALYQKYGM